MFIHSSLQSNVRQGLTMVATAQVAVTKLLMFVLAFMAMPMDDGETIRIDRLEGKAVEETVEIDKTRKGWRIFRLENNKRTENLAVTSDADANGRFVIRDGQRVIDKIDLRKVIDKKLRAELPKTADKKLALPGGNSAQLRRSGAILYLTSGERDDIFVVRKK